MSHNAKITINIKTGKNLLVVCGECGKKTDHQVITSVQSYDCSASDDIQVWDDYFTMQCLGCKALSFCKESTNSEDTDSEGAPIVITKLFPGRIAGRALLEDLYCLPWNLRMIYEETRLALMENLPILAGIGIRAIVETVCNENEASGHNLAEKIQGLLTLNLITSREVEFLHDLRFMGNEAAHKVKSHSRDELNLAFDVVEHLLKMVYLLPEKVKRLPSRSGKSQKSNIE